MKILTKSISLFISALIFCGLISFSAFAASAPKNPSAVKASSVKADSVVLSWKKSSSADFYRIYVKKGDKWSRVDSTKETKYTVKKLNASKTYSFAVKSVKKSGDKKLYGEGYTTVKAKTKSLQQVSLSGNAGVRTVELKWTKAPGAAGYRVYQRIDGKWKSIKKLSSSKLSYTVTNLKPDKAYSFAVRPYTSGDGKQVYGPASDIIKVRTYKANKVKLSCISATSSSARLTWTKADDATGYRVYHYVDGKWKTYKTLNSRKTLSLTVKNLKSDSVHAFRVRPYLKKSSGTVWFDYSDTCKLITDPTKNDLTVYRTQKLKKLLAGEKFTISLVTKNKEYGKLPVIIAKRGSSYCLNTKVNEVNYVMLSNSSGNYVILKNQKAYVKLPVSMSKTVNLKDAVDSIVPAFSGKGKATLVTFNNEKTVCETFTNKTKTRILKYYYRGGSLVGIEECNSTGTLIESATVKLIEDNSKSSMFKIPQSYKQISLSLIK